MSRNEEMIFYMDLLNDYFVWGKHLFCVLVCHLIIGMKCQKCEKCGQKKVKPDILLALPKTEK